MARKSTLNGTGKFMLTLCGIWPGTSCVLFCRMLWVIPTIIILFCHYFYFRTHVYSAELLDLMDCLSSFLAYLKVFVKCLVFWFNQRKFIEILTIMTDDWRDCAHSDISMQKAMSKAKISDRIINWMTLLHTLSVTAYCVGLMFADVDVTDQTTELPYFSKIDIPFNIKTLRTYRLLLITQFVHMLFNSWATGITNALLVSLTLHAAGQFDIMCYWLTQLVPYENKNKHISIVPTKDEIIQKHQRIIHFAEKIESLYTYIALLLFTSNTIMICSLGFLIVTAIGEPNAMEVIMRSTLFYTITNLEAFIFCYAGEYLKHKSNAVSLAVYDIPWYNLKSKDNRVLLFIIKRSQKQLTLTAGKMMDLSLESFTNIMNASGSYLSMLLAIK